ncbi:hypothetical protein JL722_5246 [Aureococcus anophagefferens]|nr:hypothetical protein JL722_5246 [Aureococcus anophagefferens]
MVEPPLQRGHRRVGQGGTPVWLDGLEDAALEAARVQYIQEDVDWRHYDKFEELFEGFLSEFNLERTKERRAWVKGIACAHLKRGQEAEKGDGSSDKRCRGSPAASPRSPCATSPASPTSTRRRRRRAASC